MTDQRRVIQSVIPRKVNYSNAQRRQHDDTVVYQLAVSRRSFALYGKDTATWRRPQRFIIIKKLLPT